MVTTRLTIIHPDFPPGLLDLDRSGLRPCHSLYIRGTRPSGPGVAIVGTREASDAAVEFTRALARCVIGAGWVVWSGGALGIDAAAHEGALEAGGLTVMVSGCGLDVPYPPEHRGLFDRIVSAGGALVGPFADGAQPQSGSFLRRNAILAALTIATVVVEAPLRSGARSTASAARRLRRPLFAVPRAPWDERGAGCAAELELGARPLCRAEALVDALRSPDRPYTAPRAPARPRGLDEDPGPEASRAPTALERARARTQGDPPSPPPPMSDEAARVLDAITETPTHADDLCDRTSLPFGSVTAALLTLTLQAVVVEAPAGFYRRVVR